MSIICIGRLLIQFFSLVFFLSNAMGKLQGGSDPVHLPALPDYLGEECPLSRSEAISTDVYLIE